MADVELNLQYRADTGDLVTKTTTIIRALRLLDRVLDQVKPKLSTLFRGPGQSADAASQKFQTAATAIGAVNSAAAKASTSLTAMGGAMKAAKTDSQGAGESFGEFAAAAAALGAISHQGVDAIRDALNDARKYAKETADELEKARDTVRELRATKGGGTTTEAATEEVTSLMLASGADFGKAAAFDTLWESTVSAAKKKGNWNLDAAQTKDVKEQALRFAVANSIDEKTIGEIVPSIGIGEKITSPDQLLGKLGAMTNLAVEGVGNFTPLMKVYERLRGMMVRPEGGGAVKSSEELLGLISTASVNAGNEAAVTRSIGQTWRELSFANNDAKRETFQRLGIGGTDDYLTSVSKIAPMLEQAQAEGKNELETLFEAGFHNSDANKKIIQDVGELDLLRQNIAAANRAPDGAAVRAENDRFRAENPGRFGKAAVAAARLGRGAETIDLSQMRRFAEAGATINHDIDTPSTNIADFLADVFNMGGLLGESGRDQRLDSIVRSNLLAAVPDLETKYPSFNRDWMEGEELSNFVGATLSPEDRKLAFERLRQFGLKGGALPYVPRPEGHPAREGETSFYQAGGAQVLVPSATPAVPAAAQVGGQGVPADRGQQIQQQQLDELRQINRKIQPVGPAAAAPVGPIPRNFDPGGPIRP